jgi:hypothetical protein
MRDIVSPPRIVRDVNTGWNRHMYLFIGRSPFSMSCGVECNVRQLKHSHWFTPEGGGGFPLPELA